MPREKLTNPPDWMIWESGEHVGEPGTGVDVVELGGLDQRVDGGGAPAAFIRSCECPIVTADRDTAQRPFGGVVGHAQPPVIEETGEAAPPVEAVGDGLGDLVLGRELGALLAQPCLQRGGERPAVVVANALGAMR